LTAHRVNAQRLSQFSPFEPSLRLSTHAASPSALRLRALHGRSGILDLLVGIFFSLRITHACSHGGNMDFQYRYRFSVPFRVPANSVSRVRKFVYRDSRARFDVYPPEIGVTPPNLHRHFARLHRDDPKNVRQVQARTPIARCSDSPPCYPRG
jgi:hypothetical protein